MNGGGHSEPYFDNLSGAALSKNKNVKPDVAKDILDKETSLKHAFSEWLVAIREAATEKEST